MSANHCGTLSGRLMSHKSNFCVYVASISVPGTCSFVSTSSLHKQLNSYDTNMEKKRYTTTKLYVKQNYNSCLICVVITVVINYMLLLKYCVDRVLARMSKLPVQPSNDSKTTRPTCSGNQYSHCQRNFCKPENDNYFATQFSMKKRNIIQWKRT